MPTPSTAGPACTDVKLERATERDAALLSNLLELYIHDLSAVFPEVPMGPDGRFGYDALPQYWSEPERRFAFFILCDGSVAGFVLATRGSPVSEDPEALDVAEFFVLRRHRRERVGRRAAQLLWNRLPGRWTVRVSERNEGAMQFWRETVWKFSEGRATEREHQGKLSVMRVFEFEMGEFPRSP